jgi:hypothetical protein
MKAFASLMARLFMALAGGKGFGSGAGPRLRLPGATALMMVGALALLPSLAGAQTITAVAQPPREIEFNLTPNARFVNCLAQYPGDTRRPPKAKVEVKRGRLNDELELKLQNVKPGLAFDLFTVQRSSLLANGTPDPNFTNFGMAWYQSDVEANSQGSAHVEINTILLDQIFGFDPDVNLAPTNTFHVGFWFNNPQDAAACGFDVTHPTPFNGEHRAGPLAMISLPDATTNLGPLCSNPDRSVTPAHCNP